MTGVAAQHPVVGDGPLGRRGDLGEHVRRAPRIVLEGAHERRPARSLRAGGLAGSVDQRVGVVVAQVRAAFGRLPGPVAGAGDDVELGERAQESGGAVGSHTAAGGDVRGGPGQGRDDAEVDGNREGVGPPGSDDVCGQRVKLAALRGTQLDEAVATLVDHLEATVGTLDAGLAVVERLDGGEAAGVGGAAVVVDVGPSAIVAGAGAALVEDVEVEEPAAVEWVPVEVNVGRAAVGALDDGSAIAVVAGVAPAGSVGRAAVEVDVVIRAGGIAHGAAAQLEVAAPRVTFAVEVDTVDADMVPAVACGHRGATFVEAKGSEEAARVGRAPIVVDVPGFARAADGGEAGLVELQHLVEALAVEGMAGEHVVGAVAGERGRGPAGHTTSAGRRMLQPRQSAWPR